MSREREANFINKNYTAREAIKKRHGNFLKELVNGQQDDPLDAVEFDGDMATNNYSIVNKFNEYYVESIAQINASINERSELDLRINRVNDNFKFRKVEPKHVNWVLRNILSKGDPELISKDVLIDAMPIIRSSFLDVINSSLEYGK